MYLKTVNALGQQCPLPVVLATRALREMTEPGILEVRVDDEIAVQNLTRMASGHKFPCRAEQKGPKEFLVTMEVTEVAGAMPAETAAPAAEAEPACIPDQRGDTVVAITGQTMGTGDDQLGATLMKGFIFALTQLETLPRAMVFYNGGAKLTQEGSPCLEDLKSLEAQGVAIWTCGACVNFYELPNPAVGQVTNMYSIAELLTGAGKVVRP